MDGNGEIDPARAETLLAGANLARIRGNWDEAIETCVRVMRSQPGDADAHSLLGDIYRDQGSIDEAIQWYRMASDLRPAGPDPDKLHRLEQERGRMAAVSGLLSASGASGADEATRGGTTQLMGYSPKRWLNTMTVISACFLAATVLVLAVMHSGPAGRGNPQPHVSDTSTRPLMPTADTGVSFTHNLNPNGPAVLPSGEQPRTPTRVHQTGEGLDPDQPGTSRTSPLPTFAPRTGANAGLSAVPIAQRNHELAPAPVQLVQPLLTAPAVQEGPGGPQSPQSNGQGSVRTVAAPGVGEERDPSVERDPGPATGAVKTGSQDAGTVSPAQQTGAGEKGSVGNPPPER